MTKSFAASVSEWARQTDARLTAVRRRSIELLAEEMTRTKANGGRVPFETGNLYRSLVATTNGLPKVGQSSGGNVGAVTATLNNNQAAWLGYTAAYARRVNSGFVGADSLGRVYNQAGNYFVEGAIANWENIVRQAAKEIESSVRNR